VILGVIPARGGSERVPGKNLRSVGGASLVQRCVRAGLGSRIDELVVSTDSDEIGRAAAGARFLKRPRLLSGGGVSSELVVLHAIECLGVRPRVVVMLQCTSPFTSSADIDECIESVWDGGSCFTAHESSALLWDERGSLNHDWRSRPMSQDRIQYEENGAVYAMHGPSFLEHRYRFFEPIKVQVTDFNPDIDTELDLVIANALAVSDAR